MTLQHGGSWTNGSGYVDPTYYAAFHHDEPVETSVTRPKVEKTTDAYRMRKRQIRESEEAAEKVARDAMTLTSRQFAEWIKTATDGEINDVNRGLKILLLKVQGDGVIERVKAYKKAAGEEAARRIGGNEKSLKLQIAQLKAMIEVFDVCFKEISTPTEYETVRKLAAEAAERVE